MQPIHSDGEVVTVEFEAASHTVSSVRKQREMKDAAHLASFFFSLSQSQDLKLLDSAAHI